MNHESPNPARGSLLQLLLVLLKLPLSPLFITRIPIDIRGYQLWMPILLQFGIEKPIAIATDNTLEKI